MSLTFGGATTDRCTQAGPATGANYTILAWVYATASTNLRAIWGGRAVAAGFSRTILRMRTGGNLQLVMAGATANDYQTNDAPLAAFNVWKRVMATYDAAGGAGLTMHIYTGSANATTPLAESTYGFASEGVTLTAETGTNTHWGNFELPGPAFSASFEGRLGFGAFFPFTMTRAQGESWFQRPRNNVAGLAASDFKRFGSNGLATQIDYSGNGLAGTVTGGALSDQPPLHEYDSSSRYLVPPYFSVRG